MISVLLYGRNDSHGYNLHKRGALSLNCLAEVLDAPGDELLFVDYNTPDDLPTFPEAIADTLTAKARERLRILRVRPAHHRRFAHLTDLHALEPVARNVALRRSRASNRWVLSTNTDMIFSPSDASRSLSALARELEDGFYHLPRFELPEALWETLDRLDAPGCIAKARDWGRRFHLDEVVRGSDIILYDAPGDFQLALRKDLFAIAGFDERMLLGWHVDSNLARRMGLLRGEVRSAAHLLHGYHCDHTRQATAVHSHDRRENDARIYVEDVAQAGAPDGDGWGLPDAEIEEIRLGQGSGARYVAALEAALKAPQAKPLQSAYVPETGHDLGYSPEHVLPYVLDLLTPLPPGAFIRYAGVRPRMLELLSTALAELDPRALLSVPDADGWPAGEVGSNVQASPVEAWLARGDIYVFEVGEEDVTVSKGSDAHPGAPERAGAVMSMFARLRRMRAADPVPLRVIVINGIHNVFEPAVTAALNAVPTPFSTRTRHGRIFPQARPGARAEVKALGEALSLAMGRLRPAPGGEVRRLLGLARELAASPDQRPSREARLMAGPLLALMDLPQTAALHGLQGLAQGRAALADARRADTVAPRLRGVSVVEGRPASGSRLALLEDWEEPDFLDWAERCFEGVAAYDLFRRSPWVWERAAAMVELDCLLELDRLPGVEAPRILLAAPESDPLAIALVRAGARVDLADPLDGSSPSAADGRVGLARALGAWRPGAEAVYDAVVCPGEVLLRLGARRFAAALAPLHAALRPGGVLLFSASVRIDGGNDPRGLRLAALTDEWTGFGAAAGYAPVGHISVALSPATLDRVYTEQVDGLGFIHDRDGLRALGLWAWIRTGQGPLDTPAVGALFEGRVDARDLDALAASSAPDADFVTQAYRFLLGRTPDEGGLAGYVHALASGTPRRDILRALAGSDEFRDGRGETASKEAVARLG